MIRILVFGMTENPGGVESFLINYYRLLNGKELCFDFLCNSYEKIAYEDELINNGSRCFHIVSRSKNPLKYTKELNELFKMHSVEWDAVWVNVSSLANIDYLKIAKKHNIKRRIIHSHNSRNMDGLLRGYLHSLNKKVLHKYATDYWACSESAARWFYTSPLLEQSVLIRNAVDVNKMSFDPEGGNKIRNTYGWSNKTIIGNVGRLHFQKNQLFMIEIFAEYYKRNQNSILVLVGQGEDEDIIKNRARSLGILENMYFAGLQKNIRDWLSCFDLFLFPSLFEGLSVAAMEAQANGVPILASEGVIPDEVKINDNFKFYSLNNSAKDWSEQIDSLIEMGRADQTTIKESFRKKGFDIIESADELRTLLLGD